MSKEIANLKGLICVEPSGEEKKFSIAISAPYQKAEEEWACSISMPGLFDNLHTIINTDSLLSLSSAFRFFANFFRVSIEHGKLFYIQNSGGERAPFMYNIYFPGDPNFDENLKKWAEIFKEMETE